MSVVSLAALIILLFPLLLYAAAIQVLSRGRDGTGALSGPMLAASSIAAPPEPAVAQVTTRRPEPLTFCSLNKEQAEDLLDSLEVTGLYQCEVSCSDDKTFTVKAKPRVTVEADGSADLMPVSR